VGELPYLLTLPAYGFYWFRLSREAAPPPWHDERLPHEDLPVLVLVEGWNSFFPDKVAAWRTELATCSPRLKDVLRAAASLMRRSRAAHGRLDAPTPGKSVFVPAPLQTSLV